MEVDKSDTCEGRGILLMLLSSIYGNIRKKKKKRPNEKKYTEKACVMMSNIFFLFCLSKYDIKKLQLWFKI